MSKVEMRINGERYSFHDEEIPELWDRVKSAPDTANAWQAAESYGKSLR
jgi:uncharacterized protein (DUF1786 family)